MEISLKGFGFNFILTSLGSFSQSAFFIFSSTWYITHIPHCLKSMWSWTIWNLTWQCSLFSVNFSHFLDSHTPERDDIISLGNVWLEKDETAVEMQPVLFMNLSVITDHFFFPHDIWHTFSIASKPCDTGQIEISDAVYLAWISAISWTCTYLYISGMYDLRRMRGQLTSRLLFIYLWSV